MNNYSDVIRTSNGPSNSDEGYSRTVNQSPGVTRVQHMPAHMAAEFDRMQAGGIGMEAPVIGPSIRVDGGAVRYTNGDAEAVSVGTIRSYARSSSDGTPGGSVAATLQRHGGMQSVELIPGNPGSRTDVRTAIREGLIVVNGAGHFEDAAGVQQQVQRFEQSASGQGSASQGTPAGDAEVFDPKHAELWASEIGNIPDFAVNAAEGRMVAFIANGAGSLDSMANALARDAGMDPAKAKETIENGIWMHQQAAEKALTKAGLKGERMQAFYDAARQRPGVLQDAVQQLVHGRDASAFVALAHDWQERNPGPEVKAFREAGFEVARNPGSGDYLVRRDGGDWVPMSELLKG